MQQLNKPTLIILAGGKSSRMGTDKAMLKYQGKTFVQTLYDNLYSICSNVILSSNNRNNTIPGVITIPDEFKGIGPMGGLYTCLKSSETDINIVVSVDTPFISKELLSGILVSSKNYDISIIEYQSKVHPLIGVYHKNVVNILESEIKAGKYKVIKFLEKTKHQVIAVESSYKDELLNINNPDDYKKLISKY